MTLNRELRSREPPAARPDTHTGLAKISFRFFHKLLQNTYNYTHVYERERKTVIRLNAQTVYKRNECVNLCK